MHSQLRMRCDRLDLRIMMHYIRTSCCSLDLLSSFHYCTERAFATAEQCTFLHALQPYGTVPHYFLCTGTGTNEIGKALSDSSSVEIPPKVWGLCSSIQTKHARLYVIIKIHLFTSFQAQEYVCTLVQLYSAASL